MGLTPCHAQQPVKKKKTENTENWGGGAEKCACVQDGSAGATHALPLRLSADFIRSNPTHHYIGISEVAADLGVEVPEPPPPEVVGIAVNDFSSLASSSFSTIVPMLRAAL